MSRVKWLFGEYKKEDLESMDAVSLGALLRERTHHTIEVPFYRMLKKGLREPVEDFGLEAQMVYDAWREKGLPEDNPDIIWAKKYLEIARKVREGEEVKLEEAKPQPFSEEEMAVVEKLLYQRRSIRDWEDKEVPDGMIEKILEAGRAAPIGCNLGHVRFIVLKGPEEKRMIWSDVPTRDAAAIIVVCHDKRSARAVGQDKVVPQNAGFDAAAAADHMLLMAHALGLGAVWLSKLKESEKTKDTAKQFKEKYGLPEHIEVDLHIALGWPASGTIKSARPPLQEMILKKGDNI